MGKILVVEDDADSREVLVRALSSAGHHVEGAENGREALAAVVRNKAEMIVLDVRMPVMDGVAFMQVLRSYLRWQDLPVVVVTAITDSMELDRVMKFGISGVYQKANYELADLVSQVNEIVPPA
jgi:CheY-like chemotaxis protein